jgi:hypothetical protein
VPIAAIVRVVRGQVKLARTDVLQDKKETAMRQIAILLLLGIFPALFTLGCFKANVNVPDYSGFGQSYEQPPPVPQAVPNDLPGLQQEVLALRAQNADLRGQNDHFRDRSLSLEKKVDEAKDKNKVLKDENERLKDENKRLRKAIGRD